MDGGGVGGGSVDGGGGRCCGSVDGGGAGSGGGGIGGNRAEKLNADGVGGVGDGVAASCCCCSTQRAQPPDPQARGPLSLWTEVWPTQPAITQAVNRRHGGRRSLPL